MKLCLILLMAILAAPTSAAVNQESVILLHGMCRSGRSMIQMGQSLSQAGYQVLNMEYPSRSATIDKLRSGGR